MARYDRTFENELVKLGYGVRCMWQQPGPKNTMIEGMECIAVYADAPPRLFIVQTLRGGGWNAFAEVSDENRIDATVAAAKALIERPLTVEAYRAAL